jgi:transcriptional regulator with XRE-family HTH domain
MRYVCSSTVSSATTLNPKRISQARLRAGLSQGDVAYALRQRGHKTDAMTVSRWERGQNTPHANVIPDMAAVLGVTIEHLYERSESGDDDEEDELALRRIADQLIDRNQDDLAAALQARVRLMRLRRQTQEVNP